MDYRTLFLFDIVTLTLYTVAVLILAAKHRSMFGISWFALSLALELTQSILQLFRGTLPLWGTTLLPQQITILACFTVYLGFRWFVHPRRTPPPKSWLLFFASFGLYVALCLTRANRLFIVAMQPGTVLCLVTVWLLLRHGVGSFRNPSRTASGILLLQIALSACRTALILFVYGHDVDRRYVADTRWLYTTFSLMLLHTALVLLFAWFFVVESHRKLRESASTDPLTGVLNRRAIARESAREISRAHRSRTPLSIVVLDIDHFKAINDLHGHNAGDQALCALTALLGRGLRNIDLIGRLGGEEFVLILPDTRLDGAALIAEKLRKTLSAHPLPLSTGLLKMTFTAGVAQLLASDTGLHSFLERADKALYRGKSAGRNRIVVAEARPTQAPQPILLDNTEPQLQPLSF